MRSIDSAVSFCAAYDIPLKVYWKRDKKVINCKFCDLFINIKGLDIYEVDYLPFKFLLRQQNYFYHANPLRKLLNTESFLTEFEVKNIKKKGGDFKVLYDKHRALCMFCFSRFFDTENEYEIFEPVPLVQKMINEETKTFDEATIGIHIRRGDHKIARENSRLELFEKIIDEEIAKNTGANFYLASDCSSTKQYLINKYGKIIHANCMPSDRSTLQGMYTGITELYSLSKTRKIYGSFGSSYSGTAAQLAGVERIQVR